MSLPEETRNELETVRLARQGDREAFTRLVDEYDRRLLYFIRRIVNDHHSALDIAQRVWLTAYKKLPKLKEPHAFRVWLYRIAHDQAVNEIRRQSRTPLNPEHVEVLNESAATPTNEELLDNAELVHKCLQSLSFDHRRVLVLRFLEDMTVREIAGVIDCSEGTVKSRLHYAKAALRQQIEETHNVSG